MHRLYGVKLFNIKKIIIYEGIAFTDDDQVNYLVCLSF